MASFVISFWVMLLGTFLGMNIEDSQDSQSDLWLRKG